MSHRMHFSLNYHERQEIFIKVYFVRFLLRIITRCSHNAFCLPLPLPFVYHFINGTTSKDY